MTTKRTDTSNRRQYGERIQLDWQLDLFGWNCTISGFNFVETKFLIRPALAGFPYWLHDDMFDHVTKRGINTQRSAIKFSCSLSLSCLITRGENLSLQPSNFSSFLFLLYYFFFSFAASDIILRYFQIVFLAKFPSLCKPNPYFCHWSLNSAH